MCPLVLSLFPGIGLLDHAFELEGFCVVRGPDVLWGGDVRAFHPPADRFDGVIGGPPCQAFSGLANLARARGVEFENLIPEFERVTSSVRPSWWIMENVQAAPRPHVLGYIVTDVVLNNRFFGGDQNRVRRISFGTIDGRRLAFDGIVALESPIWEHAVTAAHAGERRVRAKGRIARYTVAQAARLQGLPEDFLDDAPLTQQGKLRAIANGVPIPMGRAIARAVRRARGLDVEAV